MRCLETIEDGYAEVEEECDHHDMDDSICMDCGKDRTEELASLAFDRAKDFRKYGEW
jgi:hypothetical protein